MSPQQQTLADLNYALDQLSAEELTTFNYHWKLIDAYSRNSAATEEGFVFLLNEVVLASPTLVNNGFDTVLSSFTTRFAPKTGQPQHASSTQGLPPIRNEVLEVTKTIEKLMNGLK
ncbi:hypothetical protein BWI96_06000 [Siphonobacter sp. SORGH_AS_0500]|uniref:hypothetical protein n=1 Tax=Siphonobacter sp. SORGH_AS_0500 TaxID=1864824 RepID=UPI000CAE7C62|nr:hypothetical protein [Siphonobacter sp. SORGH_AS_0500]PKK37420.1 hypothetical protein BWI96_06000 [Siphonobacter sp. SORGH_AS_0500]